MINTHISTAVGSQAAPARIHRVSPRGFWMLFAVEAAFVALVIALVLYALPLFQAPLARGTDVATVRDAIWSRLNGDVADPLVGVAPGVTVRSSNLRGFALNGQTYYYYVEGKRDFDPLSRGIVSQRDVEIVLRDSGGPQTLVIYRLIR